MDNRNVNKNKVLLIKKLSTNFIRLKNFLPTVAS